MWLVHVYLSYYFTTESTASAIIAAFHAGPDLHSTTQDMHTWYKHITRSISFQSVCKSVLLVWGATFFYCSCSWALAIPLTFNLKSWHLRPGLQATSTPVALHHPRCVFLILYIMVSKRSYIYSCMPYILIGGYYRIIDSREHLSNTLISMLECMTRTRRVRIPCVFAPQHSCASSVDSMQLWMTSCLPSAAAYGLRPNGSYQ